MINKFSKPAARLALGVAFLLTPPLLYSAGILAIPSAHAAKGGNGNSGGNSNGNSGGNANAGGNSSSSSKSEKSSSAKAEKTAKAEVKAEKVEKISNGDIASKLGALNAAHASATALANASPNSRVGKIAAYRDANAASVDCR